MKLAPTGQILAANAPIVQLMDDLGEALNQNPDCLFLGGGNPACVPAAQPIFQEQLKVLSSGLPHELLGIYQSPQGNLDVLQSIAKYLQKSCGWQVSEQNIAIVSGSQTAFFILFNLFCDGNNRALLPVVPEYLGYGAQSLSPGNIFVPTRPLLKQTGEHRFKYHVNFAELPISEHINLMCVSRPANPSGNVITDDEVAQLAQLAQQNNVPLVLDYAYGLPFPGLVYSEANAYWDDNTIAVLSLSKLGLPGARSAIVVAVPEVIEWVARANTNISLAGGNLGPHILKGLLEGDGMAQLTKNILPAFYQANQTILVQLLDKHLSRWNYQLHEPEGGFFCWLWLPELPISTHELYQRLKAKSVIVMPGETFFFGLQDDWPHAQQCIRLTYCQPPVVLEQAVKLIAEELNQIF